VQESKAQAERTDDPGRRGRHGQRRYRCPFS
jgi:hypothetical protein